MPSVTTSFQHSPKSPKQCNKGGKVTKDWKGRNKTIIIYSLPNYICRKYKRIYSYTMEGPGTGQLGRTAWAERKHLPREALVPKHGTSSSLQCPGLPTRKLTAQEMQSLPRGWEDESVRWSDIRISKLLHQCMGLVDMINNSHAS